MADGEATRLRSMASAPAGSRTRDRSAAVRRLLGVGESIPGLYALHIWALFSIVLSNVFLGLAIVLAAVRELRGAALWARHADLLRPLLIYAALLVGSAALSRDPGASLMETGELLSLAAIPLGLLLIRSERWARRIVNGLIAVAAGVALYGLSQFLVGYGVTDRIRGPFSIYMTFAGFLMLADLLLISRMIYGEARRGPWRWLALLLINLALLGSLTRSSWVGLAVTVGLLLLLRAPRYLPFFAVAAALLVLLAPGAVGERLRSITDLTHPANYDRLCMLEAGIHMTAERPLLGIGPGMVERLYPEYRHPTAVSESVPHLHNNFIHIAAERGLLSLAAYLWMMGVAMVAAYRGFRSEVGRSGGHADLYMGALTGLAAFNLAGLFEYNWGDTEVQRVALFLVVLPLALRARRLDDGDGAEAPAP